MNTIHENTTVSPRFSWTLRGKDVTRVAGVEAASQALGHSDLSTTLGIYGDQDQRDLERAMEAFAAIREADDETASRGNDSPSRLD